MVVLHLVHKTQQVGVEEQVQQAQQEVLVDNLELAVLGYQQVFLALLLFTLAVVEVLFTMLAQEVLVATAVAVTALMVATRAVDQHLVVLELLILAVAVVVVHTLQMAHHTDMDLQVAQVE
jgi:hypothetical protein